MTVLEWWCQDQQRRHWSRILIMTIDILSISAMSDETERVFSETCCTVSWKKDTNECWNSWVYKVFKTLKMKWDFEWVTE